MISTKGYARTLRLSMTAIFLGMASGINVAAQSQYPTSSEITAIPLDDSRRELLAQLITTPRGDPARPKTIEKLCPHSITRSTQDEQALRQSLAVVENSLATEILFERSDSGAEKRRFSFLVEFSLTGVSLKHRNPRYKSEAGGSTFYFANNHTQVIRAEGKLGADMLVFIPTVRDCGVQGVLLCPRSYRPLNQLIDSSFIPVEWRHFITAKADGLYSVPNGSIGKVMASIQATRNIKLPSAWFKAAQGTGSPAATMKFTTDRATVEDFAPFVPLSLPDRASLESRLDFGSPDESSRYSSRRTTVEVSSLQLPSMPALSIGNSEFTVAEGACVLVAQWSELRL